MEKIKLEILGLSPSQSQAGSFALVLGEEYGNRRLPIIIGMFEAQAIAIEIEKIVPNRPMTHDLFKSFAKNFHYSVTEIQITDLKEGIFFAKIICSDGLKEIIIDARPSDAIAIGLRFEVPIYTNEIVLDDAGITTADVDNAAMVENDDEDDISFEEKPKKSFLEQLREAQISDLHKMLTEALGQEEYERAAKIRDEIGKRN